MDASGARPCCCDPGDPLLAFVPAKRVPLWALTVIRCPTQNLLLIPSRRREKCWLLMINSENVVESEVLTTMEEFHAFGFSLLGGPLHRLGLRLGLVREGKNTVPLGLALGLFSWSILLALAFMGGVVGRLFSLSAIAGDIRLLVVIPLFFLCETSLDPRFNTFVATIVRSGVVPSNALPELGKEIARMIRWKDACLPEALCLFAAVLLSFLAPQLHLSGKTSAFDPATQCLSEQKLSRMSLL